MATALAIRHLRIGSTALAIFFATTLAVFCPDAAAGGDGGFFALGEGQASCGEFLSAAEGARRARLPGDKPNVYRDPDYGQYVNFADGFITGANWADRRSRMRGWGTDHMGRMVWIESYCRNHPLDPFIAALIKLRSSLPSRP